MSYQAKVYMKQGGDELVVASGGKITVESGGAIEPDGEAYIVTAPDEVTLDLDGDGKLALHADMTALLDLLADLPTTDPADGSGVIWNDDGVLKVASTGD